MQIDREEEGKMPNERKVTVLDSFQESSMINMNFTEISKEAEEQAWPEGRSGHCICSDNENFLYVFGGYNPKDSHSIYNQLWRYNTSSNVWTILPDKENGSPLSGASISMTYWDQKIITFGGTGYPFAEQNSNHLSLYCLRSYKWFNLTKLAKDQAIIQGRDENETKVKQCGCTEIRNAAPNPKYGQSITISPAGKLYVFAGTLGLEFENDLHSFCLHNMFWTAHNFCSIHRDTIPEPRYRHASISKDNRFYVLGGATSYRIFGFRYLHSFNYDTKIWEKLRCTSKDGTLDSMIYPEPRHSHVCVEYQKKVILIGGLPLPNRSLDDIWVMDLETLSWTQLQSAFPSPIYFHAATMCNNELYVFGGTDTQKKRVNKLHVCQMNVKSLKRQCWTFVAKQLKQNKCLDKQTLADLGIPKSFNYWIDDLKMLAG
ncbi:kelch domain-containing protein 10-like isoform X2 [Clytia hemisphaerica]|uniref:Kelch domain-containing protein 10 n=1 Tax=Clytia hemisphaerica TaxID=252671 RepID=A0A7M5TPY7_9CNID